MSSSEASPNTPAPSLGKPTTRLLMARVFNFVPVLVISIATARTLGVGAFGEFAYALGIAAIFGLVPNFGIGTVVTRAIAAGHAEAGALFEAGMRLQILLSASVIVIAPMFAAILPAQQVDVGYVALAAVQVALSCISWTLQSPAVARMQYSRIAGAGVVSGVAAMIFALVVAARGSGVAGFLWARILGSVVALLGGWVIVRDLLPEVRTRKIGVVEMLRRSSPVGLSVIVFTLYERLDTVLLGQISTTRAVGLYNVAYKPANAGKFVGHTLGATALPVVAQSEGAAVPRPYSRILRALGVIGPAMAIAFTGVARELIVLLYGEQYGDAAPVASVLIWSLAAAWIYLVISNALIAKEHTRVWAQVLVIALVVNFAANFWAIPRWGAVGAASTTFATDLLVVVLAAVASWRLLGYKPDLVQVAKVATAVALASVTLLAVDSGFSPLDTLVALLVYAAGLGISGAVRASDIARVRGWVISAIAGGAAA